MKNKTTRIVIAVIAAAVLLAAGIFLLTKIQSPEDYYSDTRPAEDAIGSVTLSILCPEAVGKSENAPADGVILPATVCPLFEGDTVYTVLVEAARAAKIPLENDGTEDSPYLVGIGGLYAGECSDVSGWIFTVNGEMAWVSASEMQLSDGDTVEWVFITEWAE